MVSMKKMQAVQPEVKAIQDRYAKYKVTDPERQKMNQEMMALYKQKGVNPAERLRADAADVADSACVLQPAVGRRSSCAARRSCGWIHDLSLRDPYYITPVLMGATMFWQQRMMPSTADPVQQKMFLLHAASSSRSRSCGRRAASWSTGSSSNLLAIGQQYLTNADDWRAGARRAGQDGRAGKHDAGQVVGHTSHAASSTPKSSSSSSRSRRPWASTSRSTSRRRRTTSASTSRATAPTSCSAARARRSTRCRSSSTPRSAAMRAAIDTTSSTRSASARARTPSCGRWRASSWTRRGRRARRRKSARSIPTRGASCT